jgi:hypothetical protein
MFFRASGIAEPAKKLRSKPLGERHPQIGRFWSFGSVTFADIMMRPNLACPFELLLSALGAS